jgi:hypothetical protein
LEHSTLQRFPFHNLLNKLCGFAEIATKPKTALSVLGIRRVAALQTVSNRLAIDTLHILSAPLDEILDVSGVFEQEELYFTSKELVDF